MSIDPLTVDPGDLCFIDSETRRFSPGQGDVTQTGVYRYREVAAPVIWAYGIGGGDVSVVERGGAMLRWSDMPDDLKAFHERVTRGEAWYVAWNAAFDRLLWGSELTDFPTTRPEHWIDAMAQAAASGLPTKLKHASAWIGTNEKLEEGNYLISLFEPPNGPTEADRPDDWDFYCEYAAVDVEGMRDVYMATRPLSRTEWETYWASERINDRGMLMDAKLAASAFQLNEVAVRVAGRRLKELTGGAITAPTQARRIADWVHAEISDPELRTMMVARKAQYHDDGSLKREGTITLKRERLERMVAYLTSLYDITPEEERVLEVLNIRMYGGSTTPSKFEKALRMLQAGRLRGQYVFNGAPQTGRFSSRGVQTHNLTRSSLGEQEEEAIEFLLGLDDPAIDRMLEASNAA